MGTQQSDLMEAGIRITCLPDPEEQNRQWLAFWQEHLNGEKFAAANIQVVLQVIQTGTMVALHQSRYEDCLGLLTTLKTHPRYARVKPASLVLLYQHEMLC